MKHYIPYEANERLDQLNRWFTEIICSKDYSDDDQWLAIRLNLLKWHELGYNYKQMQLSEIDDFSLSEHIILYKIYNYLNQISLFRYATKEAAIQQKFEQAAHYRDLAKLSIEALNDLHESTNSVVPFFKLEDDTLILKHIDNHFASQDIKERLRR